MDSLNNMISQLLIPNGVVEPNVIAAFRKIKREDFVLNEYKEVAYTDCDIPVYQGSGQKMLYPSTAGNILQKLSEHSSDLKSSNVLQIGTGTGYFTALLSTIFASVTTIDVSEQLINQSRLNIEKCNVNNCSFYIGDGLSGKLIPSKFNYIILSGSLPFFPNTLNKYFLPDSTAFGFLNRGICSSFCKITMKNGHFVIKKLFETQIGELQHELPNNYFSF